MKKKKRSSPSTTSTGEAQSNAKKDSGAGGSTSGSEKEDTPKKNISSSASIVTAPKAKAESVHTKNSFTPGPWEVSNYGRNIIATGPKKVFVCEVLDHVRVLAESETVCSQEATLNARLIAAVPDLLNALKHALPGLIGESEKIARAAIRKAQAAS